MTLSGETSSMSGKTIAPSVGDENVKPPQAAEQTKSSQIMADMEKKILFPQPEPESETEPEPVKIVAKKADRIVSVKAEARPEPGRKLALKKKTFHPEKVLDNAVKSIEKSVEKKTERSDR